MKAILAFPVLSFLLLSQNGAAQGIQFGPFPKKDRSYDYETNHYETAFEYRLKNASAYLKAGVRQLELFRISEGLVFMLRSDKEGRIVKSRNCGRSHSYVKITDSLFNTDSITVIDSFFHRGNLTRVDTTIIEHRNAERSAKEMIQFDKIRYKSYKSGEYLNERNDYYRRLFNAAHQEFYIIAIPDHGRHSPRRRVDGNFDPYQRRWIEAWPRRIWTGKSYNWKKFYLTQTKTTYCNIRGASAPEQYRLGAKNRKKLFVPGESIDPQNFPEFYSSNVQLHGCIRYPVDPFPPISRRNNCSTNNKNLTDTIYTLIYFKQPLNKPCVKPLESSFKNYLDGYSGAAQKIVDFYFRYEYFRE
jgi:hypothetical protein